MWNGRWDSTRRTTPRLQAYRQARWAGGVAYALLLHDLYLQARCAGDGHGVADGVSAYAHSSGQLGSSRTGREVDRHLPGHAGNPALLEQRQRVHIRRLAAVARAVLKQHLRLAARLYRRPTGHLVHAAFIAACEVAEPGLAARTRTRRQIDAQIVAVEAGVVGVGLLLGQPARAEDALVRVGECGAVYRVAEAQCQARSLRRAIRVEPDLVRAAALDVGPDFGEAEVRLDRRDDVAGRPRKQRAVGADQVRPGRGL